MTQAIPVEWLLPLKIMIRLYSHVEIAELFDIHPRALERAVAGEAIPPQAHEAIAAYFSDPSKRCTRRRRGRPAASPQHRSVLDLLASRDRNRPTMSRRRS